MFVYSNKKLLGHATYSSSTLYMDQAAGTHCTQQEALCDTSGSMDQAGSDWLQVNAREEA